MQLTTIIVASLALASQALYIPPHNIPSSPSDTSQPPGRPSEGPRSSSAPQPDWDPKDPPSNRTHGWGQHDHTDPFNGSTPGMPFNGTDGAWNFTGGPDQNRTHHRQHFDARAYGGSSRGPDFNQSLGFAHQNNTKRCTGPAPSMPLNVTNAGRNFTEGSPRNCTHHGHRNETTNLKARLYNGADANAPGQRYRPSPVDGQGQQPPSGSTAGHPSMTDFPRHHNHTK